MPPFAPTPSPRGIAVGRPGGDRRGEEGQPVEGVIRADFDPRRSRAATKTRRRGLPVTVLTDIGFFQGSDEALRQARAACALPVLRKDFRGRCLAAVRVAGVGADCVLLIAAALDDAQLAEYAFIADELGMDVLVEVHDIDELWARPAGAGAPAGINNRNLQDLRGVTRHHLGLQPDGAGRPGAGDRERHPRPGRRGAHARRRRMPFWSARPSCAPREPGAALRQRSLA